MNTLFRDIQSLFERTYARAGINFEDCLIDRQRCRQLSALAGPHTAELSLIARTFVRATDGRLAVGIYYSNRLIEQLERHDPRRGLNGENIGPLIVFVEEINHALHAALRFRRGEHPDPGESYARNLELQAKVDTYLVLLLFTAYFRKPQSVTTADRRWLRDHLFDSRSFRDRTLAARYAETTVLARRYTRFLERLPTARRIAEIRVFHALDYPAKRRRILALRDRRRGVPTVRSPEVRRP